MFTIKLVERNSGQPAKSQRVAVGFDGFGRAVTNDEWTDDNGEAHFDNDNGTGEVYINGKTSYKGEIKGKVVIYV
jgi:hypothetical protein